MSLHLTYIIGEPGIGKSTLVAALCDPLSYSAYEKPFLHRVYENGVVVLGGLRTGYPGTDTLPLDASPKVVDYLRFQHPPLVLGEGARLGTAKFLISAQSVGYEVHLYHLVGTGVAARRRRERESAQKESFVKGQRTKSAALAKEFGALDISPTMDPDFLVKLMTDPVARAFHEYPR